MLQLYLTLAQSEEEGGKFERIYREHKGIMLSCAFRILGDEASAEDAVHNAFLKILKNLDKIGEVKSPKTRSFVITVTQNEAKTMYSKRKKVIPIDTQDDMAGGFNVEAQTESKLTAELIAEKIAELPSNYAEILVLRFLNGYDNKQISEILSLPPATVRKRLERARKMLIQNLGGSIDG